jgi:hypothetical protein
LVRKIYEERIAPKHSSISFVAFHCRVKSECRLYLKKNP